MLPHYLKITFLSIYLWPIHLNVPSVWFYLFLHGADIVYIDKVPTPNVLIKAFSSVKPTMMLSVPLIIEKIYKNKILPKFTGSFVMRTLYAIPFARKILNKIAGKKLMETFGGRIKFFGIGGAALSPFVEKFLKRSRVSLYCRLWFNRNLTTYCRGKTRLPYKNRFYRSANGGCWSTNKRS